MSANIRRIAKNVSVEFGGHIGSRVLSFVLIVVLARELGVHDFGVYSFVLAFTTLFLTVADFGTTPLLIREIARTPEEAIDGVNNVAAIRILGGGALVLLAVLGGWILSYPWETFALIVLIGVSKLVRSIGGVASDAVVGFERMEFSNAAQLSERIATTALTVSLVWAGFGLLYVGWAFILGSIVYLITSLVGYVYILDNHDLLGAYRLDITPRRWKEILSESWPFMMAQFFKFIYFDIDTVMISVLLGQVAVGWYSGAYRLMTSVGFISSAVMNAFYPVMSQFYGSDDHESLGVAFDRTLKYMVAITVPLGVGTILTADEIVPLIYGSEYGASVYILQILIWAQIVIFHNHVFQTILYSINRQKITMVMGGSMAIFNILANLILIPSMGITGAAIATVLTELFGGGLALYWTSNFYRFPNYGWLPNVFVASGMMGIVVFVLDHLGWSVYVLVPVGILVYAFGALVFDVVDETDLDFARRVLSAK